VDEHKRKNMNFVNWKDFKKKKNEENDSSGTSYDSAEDSDYECANKVEEKAMELCRKHKYNAVFKQS